MVDLFPVSEGSLVLFGHLTAASPIVSTFMAVLSSLVEVPSFNTRYMNSHRTPFDAELVSSSSVCGHLADDLP